jgi:hypothetical protein
MLCPKSTISAIHPANKQDSSSYSACSINLSVAEDIERFDIFYKIDQSQILGEVSKFKPNYL